MYASVKVSVFECFTWWSESQVQFALIQNFHIIWEDNGHQDLPSVSTSASVSFSVSPFIPVSVSSCCVCLFCAVRWNAKIKFHETHSTEANLFLLWSPHFHHSAAEHLSVGFNPCVAQNLTNKSQSSHDVKVEKPAWIKGKGLDCCFYYPWACCVLSRCHTVWGFIWRT